MRKGYQGVLLPYRYLGVRRVILRADLEKFLDSTQMGMPRSREATRAS
jgi:hypothetical protein